MMTDLLTATERGLRCFN